MSTKIASIRAQEILDSRGFPTVAAAVTLEDGTTGWAAVPSGASTGEHEAVELRDGDKARYFGKGVSKAVANANGEIAKAVKGMDAVDCAAVDRKMIAADGTENKGRLGANAILAVSMASARAAAGKTPLYEFLRSAYGIKSAEWLLPAPMLNVINGGKHADSGLDVQEFMIVPVGAPTFADALRQGAEIYQILKKKLAGMGMTTAVGDEGGFAPKLKTHVEALDVLVEACKGYDVRLALDCAASEYYKDGKYVMEGKPQDVSAVYAGWVSKYGIVSIEVRLAGAHRQTALPHHRRRPVRHQPEAPGSRHQGEVGQRHPHQAQPDRHPDRDRPGRHRRAAGGLLGRHLPPLGRDRGQLHRRPGRRLERRRHQDRRALPLGAPRQVQPPAPDRGGVGREGVLREGTRLLRAGDRRTMKARARAAALWLRENGVRIAIASGVLAVFFGNAGFRSLVSNWLELRRLKSELVHLEHEEKELDGQLKALRSGEGPVERLARRELGYIKKGEIEYRFPPPEKP